MFSEFVVISFIQFEHANSSLVPRFGGVGMGSCFVGGTLTGGNRFRK